MNRRRFLTACAAGAAAATVPSWLDAASPVLGTPGQEAARQPLRNWAWLRGNFPTLESWQRQLATIRAAGIDSVLYTGNAEFYRTHAPAAKQEGLELHAWMFTMMRGEFRQAHPEWYAVSRAGVSTAVKPPYVDYYTFMCPVRDEVREAVRGVVRELASVDGLASIHLDYVRFPDVILPVALWPKYHLVQDKEYPDFDFCYCDVCRVRFKRQSGIDPKTLTDPPADAAWRQFRYDAITSMVTLLAGEAHAHGKQLTAAVFPTPTIARTLVRQDWTKWPLDAVLPMTYHGFYNETVDWIETATREGVTALAGRIPLYSGLYVPDLSPADLARAIARAYAGGAQGVSLFQAGGLTPEHWSAVTQALKRSAGAGRSKARGVVPV